jgi:hypothetical protein
MGPLEIRRSLKESLCKSVSRKRDILDKEE